MLPDVETENRLLAFHQRVVLIRRARDGELSPVVQQPHPPAAESSGAGLRPLALERIEAAKRGGDRVGHLSCRRAARVRSHPGPEHRVIPVAAAVVAHRVSNAFGHAVDAATKVLDALALQLWV